MMPLGRGGHEEVFVLEQSEQFSLVKRRMAIEESCSVAASRTRDGG